MHVPDIFQLNPVLENERVLLRPLVADDFDHLLSYSLNEPDTWKYGIVTAAGPENLKSYIQATLNARDEKKEFPFIVFDKVSGSYAGSTRFYDIQQQYQSTQLGYTWYGQQFRRTGLNRHCKLLLLTFAFEKWNLERVEFRADATNAASIAAMKAIGCVEEGILRSHTPTAAGYRRDAIVLSILRKEWFDSVKSGLQAIIHS